METSAGVDTEVEVENRDFGKGHGGDEEEDSGSRELATG